MTLKEAYEKYEHMDRIISDPVWLESLDYKAHIMHDLWGAVKEAVKDESNGKEE